MVRILLIEDDVNIARVIKYYLAQESNYDVCWAKDAQEAMTLACAGQDIILLDIMLPGTNGIDLCRELRQWYKCPILFISCLSDSDTIIRALENGGDDYLIKPFDNKILHAKIQAALRRIRMEHQPQELSRCVFPDFSFDPEQQTIVRRNETLRLLSMEARLLYFLIQHAGECFPAVELYQQIWGGQSWGDSRTVTVHIYNLRKKIEDQPKAPRYIKNIWGKGYCFDPAGIPDSSTK